MHKNITTERLDNLEESILKILEGKSRGEDDIGMKAFEISVALQFIKLLRERLERDIPQYPILADTSFNALDLPYQ